MDVSIPKPEHTESSVLQRCVSGAVGSPMIRLSVLTAVEFDDNLLLETREIDDETTQRHLTTKLVRQATSPYAAP